MIKRILKCV